MISLPLFKKSMKSVLKLGCIFLIIIAVYDVAVIYMFDPQLTDMLTQFQILMPEMMSLFGMTGDSTSLVSFLNTYLYGMVLIIFPMIYAIVASNKLIMSYVDKGSMASLLATPNSRFKIIFTQMLSILAGLLFIIIANIIVIIAASGIMFPGELDIAALLELNLSLFFLQLAVTGITFFAACVFNETKNYYMLAAGLPIIFYVLQMMANMGGKLENCKYFTLITLFESKAILNGDSYFMSILVLALISMALYTCGIIIFRKRNLTL